MSLEYNRELIPRAKELRQNMTKQEKHLWYDWLSKYPVRFQRQKTIAEYIVDFYCHQAKLVVELDGIQHHTAEARQYDTRRTAALAKYGLEVIRFTNKDVDHNFPAVCEAIDEKVKQRVSGGTESPPPGGSQRP